MKGFECGKPYNDFIGYKVFHKKEGRWFVCLVNKKTKQRTSKSLARFLVETQLGRKLKKSEHVDHVDGNKTNDTISNLQVLSQAENNRKSVIERKVTSKPVRLRCPVCLVSFERPPNFVNSKIKKGKAPCCSRRCGGINSHR